METDFLTLVKKRLSEPVSDDHLIEYRTLRLAFKNLAALFSREQQRVVLLEDFKRDPFTVMADLLAFLEVEPFDYQALAEKMRVVCGYCADKIRKVTRNATNPYHRKPRHYLDEYHALWNEKLKSLMPETNIPW